MGWSEMQKKALTRIQNMGFEVLEATQMDDYSGFDCTVIQGTDIKRVDVKAVRNLDAYDTVVVSLMHSTKEGGWDVPKYMTRNDVYVWIVPIDTDYDTVYEVSPDRLSCINNYCKGLVWKTSHDYFGRKHLLAVLGKDECYQLFIGSSLYSFLDGKSKYKRYPEHYGTVQKVVGNVHTLSANAN